MRDGSNVRRRTARNLTPTPIFDGDYVVAVPARDLLMITGSNNQAGIAQLRALARQAVQQGAYTIVDTLFVFRNGNFERFE